MKQHPTRERLQELFIIDAEAGSILWRRSQGRAKAGGAAGRVTVRGYWEICVDRRAVFGHAVIWFMATGDWPTLIDHINGDKLDNRVENLRLCDAATNARNRLQRVETKLLGAHARPDGKFSSYIVADGEGHYLGVFESEQEAHERYMLARKLCAEAERAARQDVLRNLNAGRLERDRRARLTVLEEIQAGQLVRAAA